MIPLSWAWDKLTGFVGGAATAGFEMVVGGLVAWVVDAVMWVIAGVFNHFLDAADPNVQADWFVTGDGPYATTAGVGAVLLGVFVFAGIAQGAVAGDVAGMLRRMVVDLPMSVLGMVGLVGATQTAIRLTDVLSTHVLRNFEEDLADFSAVVSSLSRLGGAHATALVVFLLGLVAVLAGLVLLAELAVRAALIYIVVALAPLVFAARLWPALQGVGRKLLDLLAALIVSKLVIAVALAVAASAAVGSGSGGEITALPEPETMAEDPGGSVTQAVGILLAAVAAFGVAAFSPLLVARLLPVTEAATVAQGVRSGPLRFGQQAMSTGYSAQVLGGGRLRQLGAGGFGSGRGGSSRRRSRVGDGLPGNPGGSAADAAAWGKATDPWVVGTGPAGPAVAATRAAGRTATGAVRKGANASAAVADQQGSADPSSAARRPGPVRPVDNWDDRPPGRGRPVSNTPEPPAPPSAYRVPPQPPRRPSNPGGGDDR
ncbi:MAG TPA: hypothetical protein VIL36_07540 [Acidimicrobiales bacterium]